MSECGNKIAVRHKNQMRKAKVESVELSKWEEKLSREVPRNTFEKRFAKWCPKMDK